MVFLIILLNCGCGYRLSMMFGGVFDLVVLLCLMGGIIVMVFFLILFGGFVLG